MELWRVLPLFHVCIILLSRKRVFQILAAPVLEGQQAHVSWTLVFELVTNGFCKLGKRHPAVDY